MGFNQTIEKEVQFMYNITDQAIKEYMKTIKKGIIIDKPGITDITNKWINLVVKLENKKFA